MFENLNDMTILGGCFKRTTQLSGIFQYPFNIVYGPNGTGKSSISRALADFSENCDDATHQYKVVIDHPEEIEEERKHVFVFNEDFIDRNVKIDNGGELGAIVMVGSDIELDAECKAIAADSQNRQNNIDTARQTIDDPQKGIDARMKKIEDKVFSNLKRLTHEDRKVIRQTNAYSMKLSEILTMKDNPHNYPTDLQKAMEEFNHAFNELKAMREFPTIPWTAPSFNYGFNITKLNNLLQHLPERATLDERDSFLLDIAQNHLGIVRETKRLFIDAADDRCPYCHQLVSSQQKTSLCDFVTAVLNEALQSHTRDLDSYIRSAQQFSWTAPLSPNGKFDSLIADVNSALAIVNSHISHALSLLQAKSSDVYKPQPTLDAESMNEAMINLRNCVTLLDTQVNAHNSKTNNKSLKDMTKHTENLHLWIGYLTNLSDVSDYLKLKSDRKNQELAIEQEENAIAANNQRIAMLQTQMQQTGIAMDYINRCIEFIFFNTSRLRLEQKAASGDEPAKYILKSRDDVVPPNRVSIGERNILALAYFFAMIYQNEPETSRYTTDKLIVIDDPISSFDKGSRAGVLALLNKELRQILLKSNSKALILSHDRQTVQDLHSIRQQIFSKAKTDKWDSYQLLPLESNVDNRFCVLRKFESDYARMLDNIYHFAVEKNDLAQPRYIGIGNQVRQVMENFCKNTFNKTYTQALEDKYVWNAFHVTSRDVNPQTFKNRLEGYLNEKLLREVLNSESHATSIFNVGSFDNTFAPKELQELARAVLIFIYGISRNHLYGFLTNEPPLWASDKVRNITSMISEFVPAHHQYYDQHFANRSTHDYDDNSYLGPDTYSTDPEPYTF